MVQEAEAHAEEDRKRREAISLRNDAESDGLPGREDARPSTATRSRASSRPSWTEGRRRSRRSWTSDRGERRPPAPGLRGDGRRPSPRSAPRCTRRPAPRRAPTARRADFGANGADAASGAGGRGDGRGRVPRGRLRPLGSAQRSDHDSSSRGGCRCRPSFVFQSGDSSRAPRSARARGCERGDDRP